MADSLVGKGDRQVPDRGYVKIETVSVIYRIQGVCIFESFKAIWTAKFVQFDEMFTIKIICLERLCCSVTGGCYLFTTSSRNICLSGEKLCCVSEALAPPPPPPPP